MLTHDNLGPTWLWRLLKPIVTATLVGALVWLIGWHELLDAVRLTRTNWLVSMYGAAILTFAIMAFNLYLLSTKLGVTISYGRVLLTNALANFYSLIVPGDMMAGLAKWAVLSASTGNAGASLSAIVLNKVSLAVPPLLLGSLALALQNPFPELPVAEVAAFCTVLLAVGLLLSRARGPGRFIDRALLMLAERLPNRLSNGLHSLADSLGRFRKFRARDHLQVMLVALLAFSTGLTGFYFATRALGLSVPVMTLVWISLALFVSRLLPLTFNNLGIREGLLILTLAGQNVPAAKAMAVGLVMFTSAVVIALIGGMCQLAIALGWARWKVHPDPGDLS